jgi:hypothetical protein
VLRFGLLFELGEAGGPPTALRPAVARFSNSSMEGIWGISEALRKANSYLLTAAGLADGWAMGGKLRVFGLLRNTPKDALQFH